MSQLVTKNGSSKISLTKNKLPAMLHWGGLGKRQIQPGRSPHSHGNLGDPQQEC